MVKLSLAWYKAGSSGKTMSDSSLGNNKEICITPGNIRNMGGGLRLDQQIYAMAGLLKHLYHSLIILVTVFGLGSLISRGL